MKPMDFDQIASNIQLDDDGLYYSKSDSKISYPEDGNDICLQIEENSFWFNHRNNVISQSVKNHSHGKVFFDIGGGNGFVAKRLQDEGVKTVLVEPGKSGALNAKKRGINLVLCSTLTDAQFKPETVDSVGLFDVVEHIEDDLSFLKNINEYLKVDGVVYITVPAYKLLWSNEDVDAGHYRRYTLKKLNRLLEDCGFSILHSSYIFSILPIPIFLFRSIPSRLGFNKKSNDKEKHLNEHQPKKGIVDKLLNRLWNWELSRIKQNKSIPFGGSCFVVAKKKYS